MSLVDNLPLALSVPTYYIVCRDISICSRAPQMLKIISKLPLNSVCKNCAQSNFITVFAKLIFSIGLCNRVIGQNFAGGKTAYADVEIRSIL